MLSYISAVLLSLPLGLQPTQVLPIDLPVLLVLAQSFLLLVQGLILQQLALVQGQQIQTQGQQQLYL